MAVQNSQIKTIAEEHYRSIRGCDQCQSCKWIPISIVKSWRFAKGCPSQDYYDFHTYSLNGKLATTLALLQERIELTPEYLNVIYACMMDGNCDVSCKTCRQNMEPREALLALRTALVEDGNVLPQYKWVIDSLATENNTMAKPKAGRGTWAEGLDVKDLTKSHADVLFHAGCNLSYDEELWKVPRAAVKIMKKAGVDVGVLGKAESCCGVKAYELGFAKELDRLAAKNVQTWSDAGIKTVVTSCAHCYNAFINRYPMRGFKPNVEIVHITQYLERLMTEGKLKLSKELPLKVTYHDACHLGRLGEPFEPWNGTMKKIKNQIPVHVPPKPIYRGTGGVYEPPRNLLRNIPGMQLVEMERTREHAWCCGAGGGVRHFDLDFSLWTAQERLEEARATSAGAIVTTCPGCQRNFLDAAAKYGNTTKVYDIVELLEQAI